MKKFFLNILLLTIPLFAFSQDCSTIQVSTGDGSITVSGLIAPVVAVRLIDLATEEYVYSCIDNCTLPTVNITGLTTGEYQLRVSFNEDNGSDQNPLDGTPICGTIEYYTITNTADISMNCSPDILLGFEFDNLVTYTWPEPTALTNCTAGGLTITQIGGISLGSQLVADGTTYEITYEVTDACGNSTQCSFNITAEVFVAEILFTYCPPDINIDATSSNGAVVNWNEPALYTNCPDGGSITQSTGLPNGSTFPIGTTEVVFHGSGDGCNVGVTCTLNVTVIQEDTGNPDAISFDCPEDILLDPVPGNLVTYTWSLPTATTTCPSGGITITQIEGIPLGIQLLAGGIPYEIIYEATDACGNSTQCSFNITDQIFYADIAFSSCPSNINVNATSPSGAPVNWDVPVLETNCPDGAAFIQATGLSNGSTFPIGTTQVEFIGIGNGVGNGCGASTLCTFYVTVGEYNGENVISIDCPADILLDPVPGNLVTYNWPIPTGTTTCPTGELTITQVEGIPLNIELLASGIPYEITYEATDGCGNSKQCSFNITDQIFYADIAFSSCPSDINVDATSTSGALVNWDEPVIETNCPDGASISQAAGLSNGSTFPIGITEVVFQGISNGCEVGIACVFNVTVSEFNCPDDDEDGVCNEDDCQPTDPSFPATPGSTCDDGDDTTNNDIVSDDGCECAGLVSVEDLSLDASEFSVYPNPSSNFINIRFTSEIVKSVNLSLRDNLGRRIYTENIIVNSFNRHFDISRFANGIYFLTIQIDDNIPVTKQVLLMN